MRPRHDAEGPFRSAQHARPVVSGVVLAERGHLPDDSSVREHRLDTEQLTAHRSVPEDVLPPGVRRDHPAHGRAVTRRQVDAHLPARGAGCVAERAERRAGSGNDLTVVDVDGFHRREASRRHHDLTVAGHARADQSRVAPLRDDRNAGAAAHRHHRDDLVGRSGPGDAPRRPRVPPGPVGLVPGSHIGIRQHVRIAQDAAQRGHDTVGGHRSIVARPRRTRGRVRRRPMETRRRSGGGSVSPATGWRPRAAPRGAPRPPPRAVSAPRASRSAVGRGCGSCSG